MELINKVAQIWWNWMGPMFWQVSILIILIIGIDMVLQKWVWPQVRYVLWLLVLVKLVLPPDLSLSTGLLSHIQTWAPSAFQEKQSEDAM